MKEIVFHNGQFITMTEEKINWLHIKDNVIVAMGNDNQIPQCDEIVDLNGATLLPGFINSHIHALPTGMMEESILLFECETVNEIQESIREALSKIDDPNEFVMAEGYNTMIFDQAGHLSLEAFDECSGDHPMMIKNITGHSAFLNSKAIRMSDQEGIYELTTEEAMAKGQNLFSDIKINHFMKNVSNACIAEGVTTINAFVYNDVFDNRDVKLWIEQEKKHDFLDIQVACFPQTTDVEFCIENNLKRIGGCICLDGTPVDRSAAFVEDYCDEPGYKGELYMTDDALYDIVSRAHQNNIQCTFHAVGDAAVHQAIMCYERVTNKFGVKDLRHRIEHVDLVSNEMLKKAKTLNVQFSVQPSILYLYGDDFGDLLGADRSEQMGNFRKYLDAGIKLLGGTDSPVTPPSVLLGMHAAVNGKSQRRINVEEALRMFTIDAAYGIHQEGLKGSLELGKQADFVILDKNPLNYPEEINAIMVLGTYIKGKKVYSSK